MSAAAVAVVAHELLCAALFYTVFCRAVRTDSRVKADIRLAFFALGSVALFGMAAPLAWGHQPSVYDLALLGAIVLVQVIRARHWRDGVPEHFLRHHHRARNRRAEDRRTDHGISSHPPKHP